MIAAVALRFWDPSYVEFKGDERIALELARDFLDGERTLAGLTSSTGLPNPPLFVYLLALPVLFSSDPVAVTLWFVAANAAGIALLYGWSRRFFGGDAALYGTMLFSVTAWSIVFSRKIWAQDLLFPFLVALYGSAGMLAAYPRHRWRAAFVATFALSIVAVTQLHMSGWFFAPFVVAAAMRLRVCTAREWIAIAAVACASYVPYAVHLAEHGVSSVGGGSGGADVSHLAWTIRTWGAGGIEYLVGAEGASYVVGGHAWLPPLLAWSKAAAVCAALACGIRWYRRSGGDAHSSDRAARSLFVLATAGAVGVVGSYLVLGVSAHPHYHIILFPVAPFLVTVASLNAEAWLRTTKWHALSYAIRPALLLLAATELALSLRLFAVIRSYPQLLTGGDYGVPFIFQ